MTSLMICVAATIRTDSCWCRARVNYALLLSLALFVLCNLKRLRLTFFVFYCTEWLGACVAQKPYAQVHAVVQPGARVCMCVSVHLWCLAAEAHVFWCLCRTKSYTQVHAGVQPGARVCMCVCPFVMFSGWGSRDLVLVLHKIIRTGSCWYPARGVSNWLPTVKIMEVVITTTTCLTILKPQGCWKDRTGRMWWPGEFKCNGHVDWISEK